MILQPNDVILGVDLGGSTTKIAGFYNSGERIGALRVVASDRITSLYGAIGSMLSLRAIPLDCVRRIVLTGAGAAQVRGDIYGIPTFRANEFDSIGIGGLSLSCKDSALVVSMGTGTAFVRATKDENVHIGGSGVGGGTLLGLAWHLFHETDYDDLTNLARDGDLSRVDLSVADICESNIGTLPSHITASNFGKLRSDCTKADISLG
ncbi:MAG: pantothenate kinase, partial [Clostridia bacterium]|nr:pantothenate kinase [Clostridia bacterium]